MTGHHFAGFSNRFWKLLRESKLVPEPITFVDDGRLTEWQLGITNLIARPTPGINDLRPAEYVEGWRLLSRKIRRYRPAVVALVGVTLYRAILPLLPDVPPAERRAARNAPDRVLGLRPETVHGARLFVLRTRVGGTRISRTTRCWRLSGACGDSCGVSLFGAAAACHAAFGGSRPSAAIHDDTTIRRHDEDPVSLFDGCCTPAGPAGCRRWGRAVDIRRARRMIRDQSWLVVVKKTRGRVVVSSCSRRRRPARRRRRDKRLSPAVL